MPIAESTARTAPRQRDSAQQQRLAQGKEAAAAASGALTARFELGFPKHSAAAGAAQRDAFREQENKKSFLERRFALSTSERGGWQSCRDKGQAKGEKPRAASDATCTAFLLHPNPPRG